MKKTLLTAVIASFAAAFAANPPAAANPAPADAAKQAAIPKRHHTSRSEFLARSGGVLSKPGMQKGRIVFLNTQKKMPASEIDAAIAVLRKDAKYNYVIETAEPLKPIPDGCRFCQAMKTHSADILVVISDEPSKPSLLVAPEDGWAAVNIARLDADLKGSAIRKFFPTRCRRELMRAFAMASGAGGTQFPENVMAAATPRDLDYVQEEFIPQDTLQTLVKNLKAKNVTPELFTTYRRACMEGWAPAPTNDIQRAVVEKVKKYRAEKARKQAEKDAAKK